MPYNLLIGPGYQVYMAGNDFDETTVRGLINDALASTSFYPVNIPPKVEMYYNEQQIVDLSNVFYDEAGSEIAYEVFDNSDENAITATIDGSNVILDSHEFMTAIEITIRATIPKDESFIKFQIETFDPTLEEALYESFEDSFEPAGWTLWTEGSGWLQSSTTGYTGDRSAFHTDTDYPDGVKEDWLWTSVIHINGNSRLTFWQRSDYAGYRDLHGIVVSEDLVRYDWLDGDLAAGDAWEQITYDLSSFDGKDIYIGFYYRGDYADRWFVDDVRIWTTTGINDQPMIVNGNTLYQNYPNPFNPSTTIKCDIKEGEEGELELIIYNLKGQLVKVLECGNSVTAASTLLMHS
ncbi:MAG: choice-of-anchor J domain-containing protein, partial [Candidatus Delongbacteria bacterium]|nr:choice-of-anchor J domain-containing protein [Candidatus Delongbacteria bacterium]